MKQIRKSQRIIFTLFCLFVIISAQVCAGKTDKKRQNDETIRKEITTSLELWNNSAKNRDVSHFMDLFDDAGSIMVVGSDSGEVFKGKEQIERWMKMLFSHRSFSWEMNRLDIDHNGNTAWVFMDGSMIVTNDKGDTAKFPYRFTGILVKVGNSWKWRLFDGAVPKGH